MLDLVNPWPERGITQPILHLLAEYCYCIQINKWFDLKSQILTYLYPISNVLLLLLHFAGEQDRRGLRQVPGRGTLVNFTSWYELILSVPPF